MASEIREYAGPTPKSLNYYLDNNTTSAGVFSLMYESLLTYKPDSLEYAPNIACRWEISDDLLEYTFWLNPNARWSDGRPITAEDVVWTWHAIVDPRNLTGPHKYRLERTEPPEIIEDGKAVRFRAKAVHWETLGAVGGFEILPKHAFEDCDFNQINFDFPVTSGPYYPAEYQEGRYLIMEKNPQWWQKERKMLEGFYNFDRLKLLFFEDQDNAFDAFKKGEIDVFTVYSAAKWANLEDKMKAVRKHWIVKKQVLNHRPIGMQGFVMNLRRGKFADRRVRQALALLLDREMMNRTLMFNQYFMHRSYWEDLYDEEHPCTNPENRFDPQAAARLFAEAGWQKDPNTGMLTKNGEVFEFEFLSTSPVQDRYLTVYNEALKAAGVKMTIRNLDWSAWAKAMDEYDFDMTWAAWGAGLFKDPEQLWFSKEGQRPGSSNIAGFANDEVDALIEAQRSILDVEARNDIVRKIDGILTREYPYILLWNTNACRILYWNKFDTTALPCGKYGSEADTSRWKLDLDRIDDLSSAMAEDEQLP